MTENFHNELHFVVDDFFAGGGGTTTGIELAEVNGSRISYVRAAINHDPIAIESHKSNHRDVIHFAEDIKTFNLKNLAPVKKSDNILAAIWASLECTNFSIAKGGLPRDADSRTLADHLKRYVKHLDPDYILIENVKEFMSWGPLNKKGKPVSKDKGRDYVRWVNEIKSYGYNYDFRILNAADYGAYTSRKRLFIIFSKPGLPVKWPEPTYSKTGENGLPKWKPVKDVLDFSNKGVSIFGRKKPLSENTYKRIYAGLIKYIAKGDASFVQQYNSNDDNLRVLSTDGPVNTVTTCNRFSLLQPEFLIKYHKTGENHFSVNDCCSTVTTKDRHGLVQPEFLAEHFIDMQHSQGKRNQPIDEPSGSILTVPKQKLISVERYHFIDQQYGCSRCSSVEDPAGAVLANPKSALITAEGWIMDTSYANTGKGLDEPAGAILASRRHHYLMNPQYYSKGGDVEDPCFTLIARMDKRPPYLITTETGEVAIQIFPDDSYYTKLIKQFMAAYGIIDIYMRMLTIEELKDITGFPKGYILKGNQSQQKKFIGNAVPPVMSKVIIEALHKANLDARKENLRRAV